MFPQPMTYIGNPPSLPLISPEMTGYMPTIVTGLRNAGLKVALTLRPQHFGYGTTLPAVCNVGSSTEFRDRFVKTDAAWDVQGYICNATDTWTQDTLANQTSWNTLTEMLDELRSKINYARSAWGVESFYIDTTIDGENLRAISTEAWKTLALEYPNIIMFPENVQTTSIGYSSPFVNTATGTYYPSSDASSVYPEGSIFMKINSAGSINTTEAIIGVASGNMPAVNIWYTDAAQASISSLYASAAALNSVVAMTDNGKSRTFQSSPGTSFTYPVTARVYFADTANNLAGSTTYCTRKATDSCYLAGVLQSTAALDLSSLPYYQIRYYDFAGNLVSQGPYATLQ